MKCLVDYIKEIIDKQEEMETENEEIIVNMEYNSCLLELQQ